MAGYPPGFATVQPGWEATVYPGAARVVVDQFSPSAIQAGDVAILAVLLVGFALLILVNVLLLWRIRS